MTAAAFAAVTALGGTRPDDPVTITETLPGADPKQPPRTVRLTGTLACWFPLSPVRQHWVVRLDQAAGPPKAACLIVEEGPDGHLHRVGGGPLDAAIDLAERTAGGTAVRMPESAQLALLAAAVLALSQPHQRTAPAS